MCAIGDFEYASPLKRPISVCMVVVGMPTWHLKNRDVERVVIFLFELQNVLARLHVENGDVCVSGAIRRTLDNLLGLCMAVLFVAVFFVAVLFVAVIVVTVIMVTVMLFVSKRSGFKWAIYKQIAEAVNQHFLEGYRGLARRHCMSLNGSRCIIAQR